MIKNKIFKYFFLEYLKIFLIVSLSLSILIWMTQAARLLELITEYGNPIIIYIKYIIFNYPKILDNIFLFSFTISMFFLFSKFESTKEISIYWFSGVSKNKIIKLSIMIAIFSLIINILLSTFITPWSSLMGRKVLGESKFSLINSLVKENNFNSPLKGLTIYVSKNDNKGNLEGIFIYEKTQTIFAKKGEVLSNESGSYLKLIDGSTHEQNNMKINIINFKTTIFDFSKYQMQNTTYPKFNERGLFWLFKNLKGNSPKKNEIREEINKRLIKPFMILVLTVLSCFLLYQNSEKLNLKNFKLYLYTFSILLIIANQIFLSISGKNFTYSLIYLLSIFSSFLLFLFILKNFINNEVKQ